MNRHITLELDTSDKKALRRLLGDYASVTQAAEGDAISLAQQRFVEVMINEAYKMGREDGKNG